MANNIFEHFQEQKNRLLDYAHKAMEYGWIDKERESSIRHKLETDVLTIGVIGQMKCGKSTFLNAFVFENDVLPAATTPMTAALSVITYGEEEKLIAEFYTKDEWSEQEMLSSQSIEGLSEIEVSRIKAARELMDKSTPIRANIEDYLGRTREDCLANIVDYVGADGKYVSITKSVKILYPREYLKGVEIVDTPGFNDPIVSRELRTKEFLKKADVVVMMLYAGRPFDKTDRTILFENVKQCGIGKVLIGVNKYDIPYAQGEMPEEIKQYVVDQIKNECRQCNDRTLLDVLQNTEPILISAEMGLLSELPLSKISSNESYTHSLNRYASDLGFSGQTQLREMSHLDQLSNAIKTMVEQEKYNILLKKPMNAILAAGAKIKEDLEMGIDQVEAEIKILNTPDDELEEKAYNLSKVQRRLEHKIEGLGVELASEAQEVVRKGKHELEDALDACCGRMEKEVESVGRFKSFDSIQTKLEQLLDEFDTRTAKRLLESIAKDMKMGIVSKSRDFYTEVEELLNKYLNDLDGNEFVNDLKRCVEIDVQNDSIFKSSGSDENGDDDVSWFDVVGGLFGEFLNGFTFGVSGWVFRGLGHDEVKNDILRSINRLRSNFDAEPCLEAVSNSVPRVIEKIKGTIFDGLLEPMMNLVEECRNELKDKSTRLEAATQKRDEMSKRLKEVKEQLASMNVYA